MGKGLFTFFKETLGDSTKIWKDLSTTLTQFGTVVKKSINSDGSLIAVTKIYPKGSHMSNLGVSKTRVLYSKNVNNMAIHHNKPHYVLDDISITLNNGKRLKNLRPEEAKKFFNAANIYKNYSSLKV